MPRMNRSEFDPRSALAGIVTVLNTPFLDDDRIDIAGVRANVRRAVAAGVSGFLVPAMASEVETLTEEERRTIVATVVEASGGTAFVVGGASAPTQVERLRHAEMLVKLGCRCVLTALPYRDERSYEEELRELAREIPVALMIQDWDAAGYGAPVPLVTRLFQEIPSFVSLKVEVVPAGPKYTELLEATGGRLHVSGGWAVGQMIEALDRGVHTFMPTGMHEIYCEIYRRYRAGRRDEAVALFRKLLPVLAFANQHLDISIYFFKRLLWREEHFATARVRGRSVAFDAVHQSTAEELIEYVIGLTRSLGRDVGQGANTNPDQEADPGVGAVSGAGATAD